MKSTVVNTSKEMMAYSDYPPPADRANYMHNTHVLRYLRDYADTFNLRAHIHFNTRVLEVRQCSDYASTGGWLVTTTGSTTATVFDAVLVCTGHHTAPRTPNIRGLMDTFTVEC
jgi:dimethylaniline monooxygenase (N-oxide forming)